MRRQSFILPTVAASPKAKSSLRLVWILAIGVVTIGSLLPNTSTPMRALNYFQLNDTVEHFCAYAFLAFLPALHEKLRFILLAATGTIMLGVSLEFAQLFADGRSWQLSDMAANTTGACVGLLMGIPARSITLIQVLLSRTTR